MRILIFGAVNLSGYSSAKCDCAAARETRASLSIAAARDKHIYTDDQKRYLAAAVVALAVAVAAALYARQDEPEHFDEVVLQCLDDQAMSTVRRTGSVDGILPACQPELAEVLGEDFGAVDEPTLRAVLATVAAANFAEYGSSSAVAYGAIENPST